VPHFVLYAANLHVGGAVQVATSVIDEISVSAKDAGEISLLVSSEVDKNLKAINVPLHRFRDYRIEDHHGIRAMFKNIRPLVRDAEAMLVVFGPLYWLAVGIPQVIGFAQPWIVYPDNEVYRSMSFAQKCRTRLKYTVQSLFFRQADLLVVELEHVKRGLIRGGIADESQVRVVRNCLSAIYSQSERWQPVQALAGASRFKLGFVGRDYSHKNTRIFPEVRQLLKREHGLDVSIHVTFSDQEWAACSPEFRENVVNAGPLTVAQCPSFYQQLDGVLFPSLLECFSATPLEAMAMGKPLFASDRPFNRDVCGDFAFYFDPLDPRAAADAIAASILNPAATEEKVNAAHRHVMELPGPEIRAQHYLQCLRSVATVRNVYV
jgi:glycosyltransferase involved in cell wall biosynthesis